MADRQTPVAVRCLDVRQGSFRGASDLPLVLRQVRFEQLSFWLNPIGALMTIVFSVVFLVLLGATAGDSTVSYLSSIRLVQYYVGPSSATGSWPPATTSSPSAW